MVILFLILAWRQSATGQEKELEIDSLTPKKPVVFREKKKGEASIQIYNFHTQIKTNGWNIGLSLAKSMPDFASNRTYHYFYIGIGNIRHPKEYSQQTSAGSATPSGVPPFVKYGKANSLFPVELSYGRRKVIGREAVHSGVEVCWEYRAGLLAGAIVPYPISTVFGEISEYNSSTSIYYQNMDIIMGSRGAFSQFSFDDVAFGLRAQSNITFSYLVRKRLLATVFVGASAEFYTKSIPLFWTGNSGPLFADVHAGIEIGKKIIK